MLSVSGVQSSVLLQLEERTVGVRGLRIESSAEWNPQSGPNGNIIIAVVVIIIVIISFAHTATNKQH